MIFDALLCVAEQHNYIAVKAIRSLRLFTRCRNILVVTSGRNIALLERRLSGQDTGVSFLDEDRCIPGIDLAAIQHILNQKTGSPRRSGWYFQQFLKIHACTFTGIADHYLIWDSDTILLQALDFFDEQGRVLVTPTKRHHKPYFEAIRRLLGLDKQTDYSFVAEHLMVKTTYMQELLEYLKTSASNGQSWAEAILDAVTPAHLATTGFSEYETYGTYIADRYPDSFASRELKGTRRGAAAFGMDPDAHDLFALMQAGYAYATFEVYMPRSVEMIRRNKATARQTWKLHSRRAAQLAAADALCR